MNKKDFKLSNEDIDVLGLITSEMLKEKGHGIGFELTSNFVELSGLIEKYSEAVKKAQESFLCEKKAIYKNGIFDRIDDGKKLSPGEVKKSIIDPNHFDEYQDIISKLSKEVQTVKLFVIPEKTIREKMKSGKFEGVNISFLFKTGIIA